MSASDVITAASRVPQTDEVKRAIAAAKARVEASPESFVYPHLFDSPAPLETLHIFGDFERAEHFQRARPYLHAMYCDVAALLKNPNIKGWAAQFGKLYPPSKYDAIVADCDAEPLKKILPQSRVKIFIDRSNEKITEIERQAWTRELSEAFGDVKSALANPTKEPSEARKEAEEYEILMERAYAIAEEQNISPTEAHAMLLKQQSALQSGATKSPMLETESGGGVREKAIRWLWPGRIPLGMLTLFVGNPDQCKSLVACGDVASRISRGESFPDYPAYARNTVGASEVLMLIGEDGLADTTVPRLNVAGADLSKIQFVKSEFRLDEDLSKVEKYLTSHPNIRTIVIDPVSNYLGDSDMNSEQQVRQVLVPLKNLAEKFGIAVLGVMHLNKKSDLAAINRIGGAMAFTGVARAVWMFMRSPDNPEQYFMLRVKNNLARPNDGLVFRVESVDREIEGQPTTQPRVQWIGPLESDVDALLTAKRPDGRGEQRRETVAWLQTALKDGPKTNRELVTGAAKSGISERALYRAADDLQVLKHSNGKQSVWSLPQEPESPVPGKC